MEVLALGNGTGGMELALERLHRRDRLVLVLAAGVGSRGHHALLDGSKLLLLSRRSCADLKLEK